MGYYENQERYKKDLASAQRDGANNIIYNGMPYSETQFRDMYQLSPQSQDMSDYGRGHDYAVGRRQTGPFRGGLMSDFSQFGDQSNEYNRGQFEAASEDQDRDVRGAASAYQMMTHGNAGTSHAEQESLYNLYKNRVDLKNSWAEKLKAAPGQLSDMESLLRFESGKALGQGLKSTRSNFNKRGLLYSGMREGGEDQKRGEVASALSSGLMGARRENTQKISSAEQAYASIGLENQKESLDLANQAFETAHANNIARLQAMQQLGHGLGSVAGTYAGYRNPQKTTTPVESPWSTPTETGGQFSYNPETEYQSSGRYRVGT